MIVVVAFLSGIMFTTVGANIIDMGDRVGVETQAAEGTLIQDRLPSAADLEDAFTQVAERVNPTVVQIRAEQIPDRRQQENGQRQNPFEGTPFEDFFGDFGFNGPQQPMPRSGLGSGVIIRGDGYVLTNNHVVEGMDELTVVMMDGTRYDAEIIGNDPVSDVAIIKIDASGLPFISVGDSDNVKVGQWVMAFGSPLSENLSNTVTAGIISATGRIQGGMGRPGPTDQTRPSTTHNFIQTDAAINPGNSGGPLVNLRGELVGVNTAIISRTGGNQGIGFAIPANTARSIADQLIESGRVERGRLGVSYGPASESLIEALDLPRGAAVIERVMPGTSADRSGIQAGDIIVRVNGNDLTNHNQLSLWIGNMKPGDTVELTVNRDGDEETFEVELGGWPGTDEEEPQTASAPASNREQMMQDLGITLGNITPQLAQQAGFEEEVEGVIVTNVDPASYAYREANLQRGAVIVEVNRQRVRNLDDFEEAYEAVEEGDSFLVRLQTPDGGAYVTALRKPAS